MKKKKAPATPSELLDCLTEFLLNAPDRSIEELKEDVSAKGIDPDQLINRVQKLVNKHMTLYRIKKAKEERENMLEKIKNILKEPTENREEILKNILPILEAKIGSQAAQVCYRKLKSAEIEDLESLLEDIEKLELLEDKTGEEKEEK
jgi:predicted DNA-binding protein YlxM (UPF0122 family)